MAAAGGISHPRGLCVYRMRVLATSCSRLRGGAVVSSDLRSLREAVVTSSTATRNAGSLTLDGLLKPLSFLTNCSAAARISSSVTGGSKLKRVLMFLHMHAIPMLDDTTTRQSDPRQRAGAFMPRLSFSLLTFQSAFDSSMKTLDLRTCLRSRR